MQSWRNVGRCLLVVKICLLLKARRQRLSDHGDIRFRCESLIREIAPSAASVRIESRRRSSTRRAAWPARGRDSRMLRSRDKCRLLCLPFRSKCREPRSHQFRFQIRHIIETHRFDAGHDGCKGQTRYFSVAVTLIAPWNCAREFSSARKRCF